MAYSAADLDLARRLVEAGHAEPGELESLAERIRKWRTWKVLPAPGPHKGQGRGRGSTAGRYDDAAFAVAAGMLTASAVEPRSRRRAVLTAWWNGADVGTDALRDALRVCIMADDDRPRGGWKEMLPDSEAHERKSVARAVTRALDDVTVPTDDLLVLCVLARRFLTHADPASFDAVRQMIGDAARSPELPARTSSDVGELAVGHALSGRDVPGDVMRRFVVPSLGRAGALATVESATRAELDDGRDLFREIVTAGLSFLSAPEPIDAVGPASTVPFLVAMFRAMKGSTVR